MWTSIAKKVLSGVQETKLNLHRRFFQYITSSGLRWISANRQIIFEGRQEFLHFFAALELAFTKLEIYVRSGTIGPLGNKS